MCISTGEALHENNVCGVNDGWCQITLCLWISN